MSHFYSSIQGNRGEATRCGHKSSGIYGHIRGWGSGVSVEGVYDEETGQDVFYIHITSGSNGYKSSRLIGKVIEDKFYPIGQVL